MRKLRRADKALSIEQSIEILKCGDYGTLSMVGIDGGGYGVALNYIYCEDKNTSEESLGYIYFHSATKGYKIENLKGDGRVSFLVVGSSEVVAAEFTTIFESVMVHGMVDFDVTDSEKIDVLRGLVSKYSIDFKPQGEEVIEKYLKQTTIFKLAVKFISGKVNRA
ncbi:MAG: pyridoxamine 5'-phosphate oxidase family protein [Rikenellaceae bacterium]